MPIHKFTDKSNLFSKSNAGEFFSTTTLSGDIPIQRPWQLAVVSDALLRLASGLCRFYFLMKYRTLLKSLDSFPLTLHHDVKIIFLASKTVNFVQSSSAACDLASTWDNHYINSYLRKKTLGHFSDASLKWL